MFRWLTDQYPDIVNRQLEQGLSEDLEVDNFYLDMNGIIHPCTHGNVEGEFVVLDETAMFKKIFLYVDRLYKLTKPTKILYLAVDGVAPRAKMNQQRSRRFRSAKEAEMTASELLAQGKALPDQQRFDSNCITPGTDFMLKLSLAIQKVGVVVCLYIYWDSCVVKRRDLVYRRLTLLFVYILSRALSFPYLYYLPFFIINAVGRI